MEKIGKEYVSVVADGWWTRLTENAAKIMGLFALFHAQSALLLCAGGVVLVLNLAKACYSATRQVPSTPRSSSAHSSLYKQANNTLALELVSWMQMLFSDGEKTVENKASYLSRVDGFKSSFK